MATTTADVENIGAQKQNNWLIVGGASLGTVF